jgi:hypothetical protein
VRLNPLANPAIEAIAVVDATIGAWKTKLLRASVVAFANLTTRICLSWDERSCGAREASAPAGMLPRSPGLFFVECATYQSSAVISWELIWL